MAQRDMLQASFKNSIFYVRRETIDNLGLKQIVHEYPNTRIRYIESQAENSFSATIEIFFNTKSDFDSFISAMKEETAGRLVLPVYGIVNNVKVMPASADIDYTKIGIYSMSVTFMESTEKPAPVIAEATISDIANNAESIRINTKAKFINLYIVPSTILNVVAIVQTSIALSQVLFNIIKNKIISDKLADNFQRNIQNADLLAKFLFGDENTIGLFQDIAENVKNVNQFKKISLIGNNLANEMYDILSGDLLKVDFGNANIRELNFNISLFDGDTLEVEMRNKNRILIINVFRIIGLIGLLESAINKEYKTTEEITKIMNDIELYFENLIDNDTTEIIINEIKEDLLTLKGKCFEILTQKKQNAYNVTTIKINDYISSKLLAYKLYGEHIKNETELNNYADILTGLNLDKPAHLLEGEVRCLLID